MRRRFCVFEYLKFGVEGERERYREWKEYVEGGKEREQETNIEENWENES